MICYRDMSFCSSDCVNTACKRHLGDDDKQKAERWWGGPDAPFAFMDFSKDCQYYKGSK